MFLQSKSYKMGYYTGPVLSRFDRFHQIGPRALKGPRASGGPFLYYEVQNKMKSHKLNPFISAFS